MARLGLVHASRNLDTTRAFLANWEFGMDASPGDGIRGFNAVVRAFCDERFYVCEHTFSAATRLYTTVDPNYYLFSVIRQGAVRTRLGQRDYPCDARRALLQSAGQPSCVDSPPDTRRLMVMVRTATLNTHFARLTGEPVAGAIEFEPEVNLERSAGRTLAATVDLFAENAGRPASREEGASTAGAFEDQFLSILLLYQPHSHSRLLKGGLRAPASRDVRRVVDFIKSHYAEEIRLEALIRVAGVPGRTLNEHFRMFTGFSPMTFLRRERLKRARCLLLDEPHLSITEVAGRCGITHLGRFSVDYARAFGESPSRTRQDGRCRRAD